jgi:hypothetical protein
MLADDLRVARRSPAGPDEGCLFVEHLTRPVSQELKKWQQTTVNRGQSEKIWEDLGWFHRR